MKNNTLRDISVAGILCVLFVAILNPFHLWMPTMVHMTMFALGIAAFGVYATFVVREESRDERDGMHRMRSGRVAFLTGATILVAGIIYQGLTDTIDAWLVAALVCMILAKIASHWYSDRHY
jgi:hypothetical protein